MSILLSVLLAYWTVDTCQILVAWTKHVHGGSSKRSTTIMASILARLFGRFSRGHIAAFLSLLTSNACMRRVPRAKWSSPRVTVVPILNRYVSCICCDNGTRGVWVSRDEYQDSRHIRSQRDLLKRDEVKEKGPEEDDDEEAWSRMYGITRHARPSPSPDSSRPVLNSDNTANLKARVGFIILAVSLTYMHRENISFYNNQNWQYTI